MPRRFTIAFLWLLGALFALGQSGCLLVAAATAAGGAAVGYAYYKGKVSQAYYANFDDAWAATLAAMSELGLPVLRQERGPASGRIDSWISGDTVVIRLDEIEGAAREGALTRISVRVGTFGDHPLSARVLAQIGAHLVPSEAIAPATEASLPGSPPPAAAPSVVAPATFQSGEPPLADRGK
jgi:hypothetical protein